MMMLPRVYSLKPLQFPKTPSSAYKAHIHPVGSYLSVYIVNIPTVFPGVLKPMPSALETQTFSGEYFNDAEANCYLHGKDLIF